MADRPILFSAPMVRALLACTKTQTRRTLKPQPIGCPWFWEGDKVDPKPGWFDCYETGREPCGAATREVQKPIKIHLVGDRLYVREHWRTESRAYDDLPPSEMDADYPVIYAADADWSVNKSVGKHRQAMHMPRWVSRITLTVTDVRIERLQDISEDDAIAEGVIWQEPTDDDREWAKAYAEENGGSDDVQGVWIAPGTRQGFGMTKAERDRPKWGPTAKFAYQMLWDHINGPGAWASNPWIIAYTFSVIKQNIDALPAPPATYSQGGE